MPSLFGETLTRRAFLERVGDVRQVGGVERLERKEGVERGVEVIVLRTGAGLELEILPSRGLDLGAARLFGRSLAWHSAARFAHPGLVDCSTPDGYHRGFGGGLLTTCGLSNVGCPCDDDGVHHTQHGLAPYTPAYEVSAAGDWEGDEFLMTIRGKTREAALYTGKLEKTRTLRARLGEVRVEIEDVVENIGGRPCALALLYHLNIGWPLLAPGAAIEAQSLCREALLGDERGWDRVDEPFVDRETSVIEHRLAPDHDGWTRVRMRSGALGFELAYDPATLPRFTQWRQYGSGDYVLGLEPGNVGVRGRAWEREHGSLQWLEPGEKRAFRLVLSAHLDMAR